jgi:cobalt transporter subunit CbtB
MVKNSVGGTVRRADMTTMTLTKTATSTVAQVLLVAALGLGLLFVAGHAQSATLHDAAHDVRHATGFPCH